jgi:CBS domain containing-hemolysin-like protein
LVSAEEEHATDPQSAEFWGEIVAILFLVLLSGIVAGLTLGLMSLDTTNLSILEIAGTPQQQYYASRIIPIRKNGHILLTTLLLTNTVINETLPILFDGIFSKGFLSVIVSTALLVLFAEIIPQAIFSKHGLAIGALFAYPVRILIVIWYIVSWPISKFLDYLLGTHTGFVYSIAELGALVHIHDNSRYDNGTLKPETAHYVQNVLDMQNLYVSQILTPASNMLMLPSDSILDITNIVQYSKTGHSYLFVYDKQDNTKIIGFADVESLLNLEEKDLKEQIADLNLKKCFVLSSKATAVEAMSLLLGSGSTNGAVALVYQVKEDRILSEQSTLKPEHKKTMCCNFRKMFGRKCELCQQQLIQDLEEEKVIGTCSTLPSIIQTEQEVSLLGMLTLNDVLKQMSKSRHSFDSQKSTVLV